MTTGTEQLYSEKGDTWPKVLKHNGERYGDALPAIRHKRQGIWQRYTWKDYSLQSKFLALGLLSLGFEPGDKLLIVGDNGPEWYYAALAAQADHGIIVGAFSELTPGEIRSIAESSEARFAMVQDQEQVDKFLQIREALPSLKSVIYWNYKGLAHYRDSILKGYREVLELGKRYEAEHPGLFERNVETGKPDDICALVYTSGTTGPPKAAVHTYRTLRAGSEAHLRLDPWREGDNVVPYLPPVWIREQWLGIGCHLLSACTLNFAEGPETLQRDAGETGPSIVINGARIWESLASMVHARILRSGVLQRYAFNLLMPVGYRVADLKYQGKRPGLFLNALYALADLALFRPIRRSLGLQNARICYSTAAVLSPEAFRFYHSLRLPLKSLYSTTEGGLLTGAKNEEIRPDTVGPPHKWAEVRISDDGEILYRHSGTFVGYHKDPEKTAMAMQDGWFRSGDSGFIRDDGQLVITDKVDHLVKLANGAILAPQQIECRLRFSPYIMDAWVVAGLDREYASAIIVIDYNSVGSWAGQRRLAFSTFSELAQRPEVYDLVGEQIYRINRTLSPSVRVRKFVNLHREFDPEEGEMTRTRKLRRDFLESRYRKLLDAFYTDRRDFSIDTPGARIPLRIQSVEGGGA